MDNRVPEQEYQNEQLMKVIHHLQAKHNTILSSVQSIQEGVISLLHHCDIQLQQPIGSASNPIQFDEDTPS